MRIKRFVSAGALALALSLVMAACSEGPSSPEEQSEKGVRPGGTLTYEFEEFGYTSGFDPSGEYLSSAWGLYSNLLLRTLVNYKHIEGPEGNELVPDLAAEMPEISDDGLTYTFTLRDDVNFGPPVSRPITSKDVEYAFRRIAMKSVNALYGGYYNGVIEGMELGDDPGPGGIPGIETPDDQTIVFHLEKPTGDFLYRLAMAATAPIPEEVAKCFTKAGEYGRYVISSSGYMLEGSDKLNIENGCDGMKPISGYDPTRFQNFVRNPENEDVEDPYRPNYIDRLDQSINTNTNDIEQRVLADQVDVVGRPTPPTLRKMTEDPALENRLHIHPGDSMWYITLNLASPPFDDIHVRKAVNWVMDKDGLRRAWGGASQGEIGHHITPDTMLNGALDDYRPYGTTDDAGDPAKAMEEMKLSKYDENGDGLCDEAPECQDVLEISSNIPPNTEMLPTIEDSLSKIGITLDDRAVADAYTPIQTVSRNIPLSPRPGWGKDYADPYTFMGPLFTSENILCEGNSNYSLVGLTPEKAEECGIPYPDEPVPSVDDDVDACVATVDEAERLTCWADLDKKLMEEVVPWVPYLDATQVYATSAAVTAWEYDQFPGVPAWSRIAVDPSKQQ
jgi:peptide/nickel transport system substrate-binding protein